MGNKRLNLLIKEITTFKRLPTHKDDDFSLVERHIVDGIHKYNYFLDEYGDLYFEKEYVRLLLMRGNISEAFVLACCEGKYAVPKYPVLFARYYEGKKEYKLAAYYYMMQANISWRDQSTQLFKDKSFENYKLWLKINFI